MIHPVVGTDFGAGRIVVHSVLRGARCTTWRRQLQDPHRFARNCTALHCETLSGRPALRSRATRTRELSASARYWMVLIVFAPSGLPTPYCNGPAHLATDSFSAAIADLSASLRRKDIMRSGEWPPVGLASGVTCPAFRYCSTELGTAAAAMCESTFTNKSLFLPPGAEVIPMFRTLAKWSWFTESWHLAKGGRNGARRPAQEPVVQGLQDRDC